MKPNRSASAAICLTVSLFLGAQSTRSAAAAQIVLNPSDVIGGTNSYSTAPGGNPVGYPFNVGQFNATQVLDAQTGPVTEPVQNGYWLNPDGGPADGYIVINLGAPYPIAQIDLFNTHNSSYNDRGTGNFTITGANAVTDTGGGNYDLSGPTTLLLSNTLVAQNGDPIADQSFAVTTGGTYQYIRFDALSVAAITNGGAGCCGANNYGLNEIRVLTPEPASVALFGLSAVGLFAVARCRRKA